MDEIQELVMKIRMLSEQARHTQNYTKVENESLKVESVKLQNQLVSKMNEAKFTSKQQELTLNNALLIEKPDSKTFYL